MGGHSSREGLDNILLSCELEILNSSIAKKLLYYYRMVDDISTAVEGNFSYVKNLVQQLATSYPSTMPLNIQISFGFSRYLDSNVFNLLQDKLDNRLTTSLAYKPLSRFNYVPFNSNISPQYKGKVHYKYRNLVCTDFI